MTKTLTVAAAAAALLAGTSVLAQTATTTTTTSSTPAGETTTATTASTQVAGDGATTQTTVAATAPTTKVVSQSGDTVKETVSTAPIVTDGAVKTSTTIRSADGKDLVQTTVAADGTASTTVASDVPVKRTVKYVGDKKIEKTTSTVVTDAPVNVQTATTTSDGQAVAVSTTASPDGDAAAQAVPAAAIVAQETGVPVAGAPAPMMTASADQVSAAQGSLASFDANKDGALSPLEFGQMVLASSAPASGGAAISNTQRYSKRAHNPATTVLNETGGAFSKADTNGDHMVSADELATWQANGSPQ